MARYRQREAVDYSSDLLTELFSNHLQPWPKSRLA
jgi:hypothetical protein